MKTLIISSFLFLTLSSNLFAQKAETCEISESEPVLDLNSITKCTIEKDDKKNTKKVSFQVTTRKRVFRKRDQATNALSGAYQQKVSEVKKKTDLLTNLSLKEDSNQGVVNFLQVDQIPLFEKCENTPLLEQQQCFAKLMSHHIQINFQYPPKAYKKGIQGRVLINYIIDKNGDVSVSNVLFPYKGELLKEEVVRIINKLPKFIPGKHLGRPVDVQYTQQIKFKIPGVKRTNIRPKINEINTEKTYAFEELNEVPLFAECDKNSDSSSDCFITELQKHVQDNFAYPVDAINANIEGTVQVSFVINNKGKVVNIRTKGSDNESILEVAAKRLIEKLPDFKPALKNNVPVHTKYQFPISFKLN